MADAPDTRRSPVQRLLDKDRHRDDGGGGHRLSRIAMQSQRSLEGYLQASTQPRWMERVAEIDRDVAAVLRELERAYAALAEETAGDRAAFAARWDETARTWPFEELNALVRQHNEWYPIERQLPINPRTGEYVLIHGRSYRRPELDADWVLERFPA